MRMLEIHTVPLWEESDGSRTLGMYERPHHPPVVGWCNVAVIELFGQRRQILLTLNA